MSGSTARRRRAWVVPVARFAAVGALGAGVVVGGEHVGAVSPAGSPPAEDETVPATSVTAYCPGDPFAGDQKSPDANVNGSVTARAAPGPVLRGVVSPSDEPGTVTASPLGAKGESAGRSRNTLDERPVVTRGTQQRAPGLVGGQSFTAGGDGVAGLAAVPCTSPTADAWLVAGGPQKGRQERLVLTNPGGNPVRTELELLGPGADTRDVVVPAHGRKVVLLDAIAGTKSPQVVHVSTRGGLVVPTIVDHHRDGLDPAGVGTVSPTQPPSTRLVVPGNADGAGRGLVIGVPGDRDAVVSVRAVTSGPSRNVKVETVPAGGIVDLEMPEVDDVHSWVIESDEPVVAAGHTTSEGAKGQRDMAWSVATPAITRLGGAALPAKPSDSVRRVVEVTAADGPAEADVLVLADGEVTTEQVTLEKGRSTNLSIGRADAVWVRPERGKVHAAVLLVNTWDASRPAATSVPVLPSRVEQRDVEVVRAP